MNKSANIVLIGAGKVAHALGKRLHETGYRISAIWSRSQSKAESLAQLLSSSGSTLFSEIPRDADLYLLLVSDQAIETVAQQLSKVLPSQALVLHSSGATPSTILAPYFDRYGVFYPLQTFSPGRELDFTRIPLCLHTARTEDYAEVEKIARTLSSSVYAVSDRQRLQLHLAAVFVNNFTNYLQFIAQELVQEHELPGELLLPLLEETIEKLQELPPSEAQTGPALRQDEVTIKRHLALLQEHPRWQELYQLLSEGIKKDIQP